MSASALGWHRMRRVRSPAAGLVAIELSVALPWLLALAWLMTS